MSLSFAEGKLAAIRKRVAAAEAALGLGTALSSAEMRIYAADMQAIGEHPAQIPRSAKLFNFVAVPVGRFLTNIKPVQMYFPPLEDEDLGHMLASICAEDAAEYVRRLDTSWDRMAPPLMFPLMDAPPPPEVALYEHSEVIDKAGNAVKVDKKPAVAPAEVADLTILRENVEAMAAQTRASQEAELIKRGGRFLSDEEASVIIEAAKRREAGQPVVPNPVRGMAHGSGIAAMPFTPAQFTR